MRWMVTTMLLAGCAQDGAGVSLSRDSELCDRVFGMEAIAWDIYNGVPAVDAVLPPPVPVGGTYSHSQFPLIGFSHAPDWTPFEINGYSIRGVDLVRNDEQAAWRYVFVTLQGIPDPADVVEVEQDLMQKWFDAGPWEDPTCRRVGGGEISPGSGIVTNFDNQLVRDGNRSVLVSASVTAFPPPVYGPQLSGAYIRTMSAPTAEFPDRLYDSFLAIDWQLLVGDPDGEIADRDGDGAPDDFDRDPDDPDVQ